MPRAYGWGCSLGRNDDGLQKASMGLLTAWDDEVLERS